MTSSSSCELLLEQDGRTVLLARAGERPAESPAAPLPQVRGGRPLLLTLRRARDRSLARLRIGTEVTVELSPGRREWQGDIGHELGDQFGEVELALEEAPEESPHTFGVVLRAVLEVLPRPGLEEVFEAMVREIEEVHVGLARDVVSRTAHRGSLGAWAPRAIQPQEDLQRLEEISVRLDRALRRIGDQPSSSLVLTRRRQRMRAGDRSDTRTACEIAAGAGAAFGPGRRPRAVGKVLLRRTEVSRDIGEHRHLREGLLHLARWGEALAASCRRSAELLRAEERRWGDQVFEQRYRPRIRRLEELAAHATRLSTDLRKTIARHEFLRSAGPPRTPFGPTPIFLGRDAYRDAYRSLVEARRRFGIQVDGEGSLRVRYRSFPTLYEYWCFIRVVQALRQRFGAPEVRGGFSLVDEVYRPELEPGQTFRFRLAARLGVTATYEPEFPPVGSEGSDEGSGFAAALVSGPLRPDVTVEVRSEDQPPVILALDAKSTGFFQREQLWKLSDYRALVHDPLTGHQPIRQLFLLHADRAAPPLSNLTGYLEGRVSPREASVLGAVPCLPGLTQHLERVLERFLEMWVPR